MRLHLADALRALQEARAHQVLGVEQADELGVLDEVAPGEERELAQPLLGIAVAEVERRLGAADAGIGVLEHDEVERLLVAEVVVEHPLVGAGARRDRIDPGAAEALLGELPRRGGEDRGAGALGVAVRRCGARRRTGCGRIVGLHRASCVAGRGATRPRRPRGHCFQPLAMRRARRLTRTISWP